MPTQYQQGDCRESIRTYFNEQTKVDVIAARFFAMNLAIFVVTDVNTLQDMTQSYTITANKKLEHTFVQHYNVGSAL